MSPLRPTSVLGSLLFVIGMVACSGSEDASPAPMPNAPNQGADAGVGVTPDASSLEDADASAPTTGYAGDTFGFWWLRQSSPARAWIYAAGKADAEKITASGATPKNATWATSDLGSTKLAIEGQRSGLSAITAGIAGDPANGGKIDSALVDRGLAAIEWGLAQRSVTSHGNLVNCTGGRTLPANSFPCQDGGDKSGFNAIHNKTIFLAAAAAGVSLVLDAGVTELNMDGAGRGQALVDRANAAKAGLDAVTGWLVSSPDVDGFFEKAVPGSGGYDPSKINVNQLLHVAVSLGTIGKVVGNSTYAQRAKTLIESAILVHESPDGILPENSWVCCGGFDVGYQTVSIELLVEYASHLASSDPWRSTVIAKTQLAVDYLLKKVLVVSGVFQLDGLSAHNTRTMECGARIPGDINATKSEETDKIPWRLYQFAYLTGQVTSATPAGVACERYSTCADALRTTGQSFDHQESCGKGLH